MTLKRVKGAPTFERARELHRRGQKQKAYEVCERLLRQRTDHKQALVLLGTLDREAILDWADQHNAAWACHAAFECTEACPSDVRPAQRIMALRRELRGRRRRQGREIPETADEEARS